MEQKQPSLLSQAMDEPHVVEYLKWEYPPRWQFWKQPQLVRVAIPVAPEFWMSTQEALDRILEFDGHRATDGSVACPMK